MRTATLHRRSGGDPDSTRIVEDGPRLSVFLLPPAALLARGLWGAALVWLVLFAAILGATVAGALSGGAALLAIVIVHAVLAIDTPDLERRRLRRQGWVPIALAGPFGAAAPVPPPVPATPAAASTGPPPVPAAPAGVIGLFPDQRR